MRKNKDNKEGTGKVIYLDHAASALPNPSSIHRQGLLARQKLERARSAVAGVLRVRPEEIIFTSSGTEGNNLAIQGTVWASGMKNPHIVTTNIEHPSVLETCRLLQRRGLAEVSVVPVETNGIVDPKKISKAVKSNTVLVSVMYANNEIGTIQPIREIAKAVRFFRKQNDQKYPYFHADAVQAVNYLDLSVEKLGVDLLTLSGSKMAGAGRVGVLYKKNSVTLDSVFGGGDQERGLRPGTEDPEAVSKFVAALEAIQNNREKESKRLAKLRDYLLNKLKNSKVLRNAGILLNGDIENRLPNNISITLPKIPSDLLVIELSERGIMCSSKSACKSSGSESSYVIAAIRPDADPEIGGVRFSLGSDTTRTHLDRTVKALNQIVEKLAKWYA